MLNRNDWKCVYMGIYEVWRYMLILDIDALDMSAFMEEDSCLGILEQLEAIKLGLTE